MGLEREREESESKRVESMQLPRSVAFCLNCWRKDEANAKTQKHTSPYAKWQVGPPIPTWDLPTQTRFPSLPFPFHSPILSFFFSFLQIYINLSFSLYLISFSPINS